MCMILVLSSGTSGKMAMREKDRGKRALEVSGVMADFEKAFWKVRSKGWLGAAYEKGE